MFVCSVWPPLPAVRHRVERGQRYIPQDRRFGNDYNGRPCAATITVEVTRSQIAKRNMGQSLVGCRLFMHRLSRPSNNRQ
jgi:hypothetical protein